VVLRSLAPLAVVLPLAGFSACSSSPSPASSHSTTSGASGSSGSSGTGGQTSFSGPVATHTSSIAISPDGSTLYVANADEDSVSILDTASRTLVKEIPLGPTPTVDSKGHYTPNVMPRTVALSPGAKLLWVAGERSSSVYAIDLTTNQIKTTVANVGSEPIGVLLSKDESTVYVSCSNDGTVVKIDAASGKILASQAITDGVSPLNQPIPAHPWALGWSLDFSTLYATHIAAPNVSALDPATLAVTSTINIPDVGSRGNKLLANGQARGLYDVVARPGTTEVWVAHMMLAVDTPETTDINTTLDFESTAFPTLSILKAGAFDQRLSTNAMSLAPVNGAFGDIVSGPHAVAFTADGAFALMLDSASEDILAVDAVGKVEATLLRPLSPDAQHPGHMQEGIVLSPDGKTAYVDERNTYNFVGTSSGGSPDVAIISVSEDASAATITLTVAGSPIPRLSGADPMPMDIRAGQMLFNTADSDLYPVTQNHWVACASCHLEGRSDAVTWKFLEGPRDTPTNAGGKSDTGCEFRTADRQVVSDYWQTIEREQGGNFGGSTSDAGVATETDDATLLGFLGQIQSYVNFGIPTPIPPTTNPTLVAQGKGIFEDPTVGCSSCHSGNAYTDSGGASGVCNLASPNLYDVGTCVMTGFPDVDHPAENGVIRKACMFNVPSLRGIASTAPYLHDGSAATLYDLLQITKGKMGDISNLTPDQITALIEYLRSL
jgi:YVTN family beta-propeller protein